jgi:DNA-binding MarR family transcriptional regulator
MSDRVAEIRAFNRFYTRVIGVLGEGMLSTPYTLTEARVLFELAHRDSVEVVDLRRSLDLDAGYLSRILARFEADGLVTRSRSAADARRQVIELTDAGRATQAELDQRTDVQIGDLVGALGEADQRRLLGAMATIQELLGERTRRDLVVLRSPTPGDLGWIVQRHGAIYAREFGWDASFEALVARIVADYATEHDPRREAAWIAEVDGLVEPSARGMGVGGRLVEECLRFAKRTGYERIMLWTYDATKDAHRIYERAGFTLDEQREATAFGHEMVDEIWSRDL